MILLRQCEIWTCDRCHIYCTQLYWLNKCMYYTVHSSANHLKCLSMTSSPTIERMSSPVSCCVVHAGMHCSLSTSLLFLRAFHYCQRFRDHKLLQCCLFLGWWHWASVGTLKMSCNSVEGFLIISVCKYGQHDRSWKWSASCIVYCIIVTHSASKGCQLGHEPKLKHDFCDFVLFLIMLTYVWVFFLTLWMRVLAGSW